MLHLLPLVTLVVATSRPVAAPADPVMSPRIAQVRLAETLASADSIDWVRSSSAHTITFAIHRNERAMLLIATTDVRTNVMSLVVNDLPGGTLETGNLGWLADELDDAHAIQRLVVDEDGAVIIVTDDQRSYMAIPGRGSGGGDGNRAVEARWAAAFDRDHG